MHNYNLVLSSVFIIISIISCVSSNTKNNNKKYLQSKYFVNPINTPVKWNKLYIENHSINAKLFLNYAKETKNILNEIDIPYILTKNYQLWDSNYIKAKDKYNFIQNNGIDCTRFLWHLYEKKMNLPYNSNYKNKVILSYSFSQKKMNNELKYFVPLKKIGKAFKPRTGDILAFPGHALAVLDPKDCISIQSASWLCKKMNLNGSCHESVSGLNAGVAIYKLMSKGDCNNGLWHHLDSPQNKFTAGWRHKALNTWIEKLPSKAFRNEKITLVGYNISNRFVFFAGSNYPSKTSYAISQIYSPNDYKLDIVSIKVPSNAQSGPLKIYWGNQIKPDINMTVESNEKIIIENSKILSSKN